MKLNEKIFTLRKRLGYSQEELAYKLGVTRQTVSKWETNTMSPETEKIVLLSKLFNVPTDTLLIDEIELADPMATINGESQSKEIHTDPIIKHKSKDSIVFGLTMLIISILGIIAIILISLFSKAAGDVTVLYTTMYVSLKTIFYILIAIVLIAISLIVYKLIMRRKHKGNIHNDTKGNKSI